MRGTRTTVCTESGVLRRRSALLRPLVTPTTRRTEEASPTSIAKMGRELAARRTNRSPTESRQTTPALPRFLARLFPLPHVPTTLSALALLSRTSSDTTPTIRAIGAKEPARTKDRLEAPGCGTTVPPSTMLDLDLPSEEQTRIVLSATFSPSFPRASPMTSDKTTRLPRLASTLLRLSTPRRAPTEAPGLLLSTRMVSRFRSPH